MPAIIDVTVRGFLGKYSKFNGSREISLSRLKCIKFAQSVGNAHYSRAFAKTKTAVALAKYRAMAIRCVLDFTEQAVRPHARYSRLESTEKVNLSYWIGMTFAAIVADNVLGVPRTTHVQKMGKRLRTVEREPKSLADLVGQDDARAWHVIEAKGRQRLPWQDRRDEYKAQARTVSGVGKKRISTRSYSVGLIKNPCRIELVDPPQRGEAIDLARAQEEVGRLYYKPYIEFLQGGQSHRLRHGNRQFIVRAIAFDPVSEDYVYLGLEKMYFELRHPEAPFVFSVGEFETDSFYVGTDGVAIATSHSPCKI
jgi:hypothetical protein